MKYSANTASLTANRSGKPPEEQKNDSQPGKVKAMPSSQDAADFTSCLYLIIGSVPVSSDVAEVV